MARIELSNIGGGTTLSLTTTGTSGASTLAGSVLNIPVYQGQLTLTTTGTSGAATLVGNTLNIPQYSGSGTPAGSTGEIQYNNAGTFGASANLAWDNSNVRLNVGAPSAPTARLNVRGGGTTSATSTQVWTNSGNTELMRLRDDGNLGIGTASPDALVSTVSSGATTYFTAYRGSTLLSRLNGGLTSENVGTQIWNIYQRSNMAGIGSIQYATPGGNPGITMYNGTTLNQNRVNIYYFNSTTFGMGFDASEASGIWLISGVGAGIGTTAPTSRLHVRGSNTSSGTNALLVQNGRSPTPDDIYKIENDGKISYLATNTAAGTTGAQTINRPSGTVNFAAGASALVVTNSLCTTASLVFAEVRTNDATAQIKNVVPAAGSFTINLNAAATAETSVGFFIIN